MEEYIQKWQELKQETKKMELKLFDALLIEEDLLCYGTMRLMNNVEGGKHITAYYRPALQRAEASSREDVYYLLVMPCENREVKDKIEIKSLKDLTAVSDLLLLYAMRMEGRLYPKFLAYDFVLNKYHMSRFIYDFYENAGGNLYYPSSNEVAILSENDWAYDFGKYDYVKAFVNYVVEYQFEHGKIFTKEQMDECVLEFIKVARNEPKKKQKVNKN